ncbi:MMPL family transporter [Catenuloplanes japonicus]|uniref:MMPL family transporter n=1 Tax=Catenuloplanes japonicus TaxID=33876 RepID=UPI000527CEEA|nr:MMPL family transporter [Catenuloplanes japonicus]
MKRPVTVRVARWSAEHPWRAIALWVVFVAVCFIGGNATGMVDAEGDEAVGESGRAERIIEAAGFPEEPPSESVLITATAGGTLDVTAARQAATDVTARMRALPEVAAVGDPLPSQNGDALLLMVEIAGDPDANLQPLLNATADAQRANPGVRVEQVGGASIDAALSETLDGDFRRAEMLSLPVTLLILIVAFGALIAAGIPVLLALSSVAAALGLSTAVSHLVPNGDVTSSVILLIGMAVGVDYSLFYLRREREERAKGRAHLDAVEIAAETSGHAVVVSGFAVMISMAGLFLADDTTFSSLAVGAILVVAMAVLGSLSVLPAVLAKLGRWVDRPRVPFLWRLTASGGNRLWPRLLAPALRRPLVTFVVSVLALLVLAVPALGMKTKFTGVEDLPRDSAAMQAYDRMTAAYPSSGTNHVIAVRSAASDAESVTAALTGLAQRAGADPLFAPVEADGPSIDRSADGTIQVLHVPTIHASGTADGDRSLDRLRGTLVPAALGGLTGAEYAVTGDIAGSRDASEHMFGRLPLVVGFVLVLTLLVMIWTFRSVVVALTAIGLNLLSAGAAYGLMVLVFQGTWAEGLLGFRSMDAIVTWLPLFLFVVLFGLSMDYHVFVVSRIREAVRAGLPNREAVAHGITSSAGVVSSAAIVMVAVFAIFGTLSMIEFKQLGVGLAAAILIDATIIRAVVLPSLMNLLGDANWWAPRWVPGRTVPAPRITETPEQPEVLAGAWPRG